MELIRLVTGPLDVNTYIAYGQAAGACIVVDPSDFDMVKAACAEHGVRPSHILLTHGHFDHILAVAPLQKEYEATVCIHALDAAALHDPLASLGAMIRYHMGSCRADLELNGGEELPAAGFTVSVRHTPGHSPGSVCYVLEGERVIFAGDTLFRLSVGRSDLPGGDPVQLHDSIEKELFSLNGDYTVYPGHARETTLDFERANNPFMRRWNPKLW